MYGRDYWKTEWIKNIPYLMMHTSLPDPKPEDNAMVFGDGPRHFEWHGPAHQLYRTAAAYRDGVLQAFTDDLVAKGIGITRPGTWLNMLWYDPTVKTEDWRKKEPTLRFFENNDLAFMRSGWDKDAMHIGFKCIEQRRAQGDAAVLGAGPGVWARGRGRGEFSGFRARAVAGGGPGLHAVQAEREPQHDHDQRPAAAGRRQDVV